MGRLRRAAACFAFLGLSAGVAQAEELWGDPISFKGGPGGDWVITLGGYGAVEPAFPGANTSTGTGRLILDVRRAGDREWLTLPNDAAGITLYQVGNFRAGAAGDYLVNRERGDDLIALYGLRNIGYTLELGGFAEYYPAPFLRTRVELLQGVTGADGFAANLMADFIYRPGPQWLFTVGPRLKFVNSQYMSTFFSVDEVEHILSGLPVYNATGGLYSAGVDATARFNVTERFSIRAFAEWNRLTGDAADNPLVRFRGSEDQFEVGIGAAYKFHIGF